ncbi:hypothetical protein KDA_38870 [Dictyobacter alpinus]|uniref:Uncharacterized protein n=1 Tax=Dictyobacter alpinus TaxID=2014873 RepID=A0A402BAI1_9CHLR|nr:hypothetical protein KDA_38870 [Dictyobacter alpinus]
MAVHKAYLIQFLSATALIHLFTSHVAEIRTKNARSHKFVPNTLDSSKFIGYYLYRH